MKNLYIKCFLLLMFLSMISMIFGFFLNLNNSIYLIESNIVQMNWFVLYYILYLDWESMFFVSVIFFISGNVIFFSKNYMSSEYFERRFLILVLLFIVSMLLMVLSPNLLSILLGWDGLGVISFCLVIYYQNFNSLNSGMITILSNRIGDFGLVISIILSLIFSLNINCLNLEKSSGIFMILVLLAALTKSAQFPFSAWLPAAMSAPTPVSALVHSSTLVTAGVYLLIRFSHVFENSMINFYLMNISLFTILLAGFSAFMEQDMKKIVAMSTLSQLGFMMFSLSLGCWKIAYFHMLTHALFKSMLFLSVGNILHNFSGNQDMRFMGGVSMYSISSSMGLLISSMSLFGIPFVAGFYSKEAIIKSILGNESSLIYLWMFIIGIFFTMIYSSRLVFMSILQMNLCLSFSSLEENESTLFPILNLSMMSILMGSYFEWMIFDSISFCMMMKLWHNFILFLIIFSLVIIYFMNKFFISKYNYKTKQNFFSIFNLHYSSSVFSSKMLEKSPSKYNDEYWGEIFGAKGMMIMILNMLGFVFFQMMEYKNIFLLFMLMMVFLV